MLDNIIIQMLHVSFWLNMMKLDLRQEEIESKRKWFKDFLKLLKLSIKMKFQMIPLMMNNCSRVLRIDLIIKCQVRIIILFINP